MATGKISKSGGNFSQSVEYDLAQGKYAKDLEDKKPEILASNFIYGDNYKEIGTEFKDLSDDNKKCSKPVMKFSVNFDPKENLSKEKQLEFTKRVMKEMGVKEDNHQFLIVGHYDKHPHHHVTINRVGMDGKLLSDSHSKYRLESAIDKIEKQMGLNNDLAKTRRFVFDETQEKGYKVQKENFRSNREKVSTISTKKGVAEKKEYIKNNVEKHLQESKSVAELQTKLQSKNIHTEPRFDKENKLTGISFKYDNYSVKGSAMGKEFKASGIVKSLENNIQIEKTKSDDKTLENQERRNKISVDREKFKSMTMEEKMKYHEEKKERVFGANPLDLRKETLQNLDKAIEKLEPHKENHVKYYEDIKVVREGVKTNQIDNIEDLKRANEFAKTHISGVEMLEKGNQNREQEKPKTEEKKYSDFDQMKQKREAKQEQNQDQAKRRGR